VIKTQPVWISEKQILSKAGVIHVVTHSSSGGLPLAAEVNPKFFKIILSDIGLMQAVLEYDCKLWILEPLLMRMYLFHPDSVAEFNHAIEYDDVLVPKTRLDEAL